MSASTDDIQPRTPSMTALMIIGRYAGEPGWLTFLKQAQAAGFGLNQPGDEDLDDERWEQVSTLRATALASAYRASA